MLDSGSTLQHQTQVEELICHWNECLRTFPNHDALGHHLSEEHIGWKRGEYCCEWTNCSRKGIKCHNRFALIMHLRIHTQEKPFECDVDGCGMNFGRLDALTRHKKAEHGIDPQGNTGTTSDIRTSTSIKMESPHGQLRKQQQISAQADDTHKLTTSRGLTKKRKLAREEDHSDKHKRGRLDNNGASAQDSSDMMDYRDADLQYMTTTTTHTQQKQRHPPTTTLSSSPSTATSSLSPKNKYKIAKAKLQYILRENEMLSDEWTTIQRRLTRLQTERRVLLDALMSTEDDQDSDLFSSDNDDGDMDDDDGDDDDNDDHHMDIGGGLDRQPDAVIKDRTLLVATQSSTSTGGMIHQKHNGYVV